MQSSTSSNQSCWTWICPHCYTCNPAAASVSPPRQQPCINCGQGHIVHALHTPRCRQSHEPSTDATTTIAPPPPPATTTTTVQSSTTRTKNKAAQEGPYDHVPLPKPATDEHKGTVYILRGLPGAGKSSLTRYLQKQCHRILRQSATKHQQQQDTSREKHTLLSAVSASATAAKGEGDMQQQEEAAPHPLWTASADDYFIDPVTHQYKFQASQLTQAHRYSLSTYVEGLTKEEPVVVVDNTNSTLWEFDLYLKIAQLAKYTVHVIEIQCQSEAIARFFSSRNKHGVPERNAIHMYRRWEVYDKAIYVPPAALPKRFARQATTVGEQQQRRQRGSGARALYQH